MVEKLLIFTMRGKWWINLIKMFNIRKNNGFLAYAAVFMLVIAGVFFIAADTQAAESSCDGLYGELEGYIDYIDLGAPSSEVGHALLGWSEANLPGGYFGGCEQGEKCTYRQAWEPGCEEGRNSAFFIFVMPKDTYADALEFRYLDGVGAFDSFNVYINGSLVYTYTDGGGGSEIWYKETVPLNGAGGELSVKFEALGPAKDDCSLGQLSLDWVGIRGYTCEPASSEISGSVFNDANGDGVRGDDENAPMDKQEVLLSYCGETELNEEGETVYQTDINQDCEFIGAGLTDDGGNFTFTGLSDGKYRVELLIADDDWYQTKPVSRGYNISLGWADMAGEIDFLMYEGETQPEPLPFCGNGIAEVGESCDGTDGVSAGFFCNSSCVLEATSTPEVGEEPAREEVVVLGAEGAPRLSVGKTWIKPENLQENAQLNEKIFKVVVANNGDFPAFGVVITDSLPEGMAFSDTGNQTKIWLLEDLAPGEIKSVTYLVAVDEKVNPGTYVNTARVSADNHEDQTAQAYITVEEEEEPIVLGVEAAPTLEVEKTAQTAFANVGQTGISYDIRITNTGDIIAFDVNVFDHLPNGLVFSGTKEQMNSWVVGDIAPGETRRIQYYIDVAETAAAGIYTNTAEVYALNSDPLIMRANLEVRDVAVEGISYDAETGTEAGSVEADTQDTGTSTDENVEVMGETGDFSSNQASGDAKQAELVNTGFDKLEFVILSLIMLFMSGLALALNKRLKA